MKSGCATGPHHTLLFRDFSRFPLGPPLGQPGRAATVAEMETAVPVASPIHSELTQPSTTIYLADGTLSLECIAHCWQVAAGYRETGPYLASGCRG